MLQGDVAMAVAKLKEQDGKDLRVIGGGKRLFRDGNPRTSLRLVESTTTSAGVLIVSYVPADH